MSNKSPTKKQPPKPPAPSGTGPHNFKKSVKKTRSGPQNTTKKS